MEYANTFSLDFPGGALASLQPRTALGPLLLRLSDLPPGDRGHLLLLFEKGKGKELHPVGGRGGAHPKPVSAGLHLREASFFDELPRVSSAVASPL